MKEVSCKKCKFLNDQNALYCQNCGSLLKNKSLKKFIKSFNFNNVAGLGQKGVSIAPLAGMKKSPNLNDNHVKLVKKSHSLEDGTWFCPYCGNRNKTINYECSNCLKPKP